MLTALRRVVVCMCCIASSSAAQTLTQNERTLIDSIARAELSARRAPGMVIAVVRGDSLAYLASFGVANSETGAPMSTDLMVSAASLTKLVTATAALVMEAEGKVSLDEPVSRYLKGLPPRMGALTLAQLLSHTSGLGDRTPAVPPAMSGAVAPVCRELTDALFIAEPGAVWSYGNTNYVLAGCVLEVIAGVPFPQVLSRTLFTPLGMTRSTLNPRVAMTYPLSQGHDTRGSVPMVVRPFNSSPSISPAGELITTVTDMARLMRALLSDGVLDGSRVLPQGLLHALGRPRGSGGDGLVGGRRYGLGVFQREYRGESLLEHEGVYGGFGASIVFVPTRKIAVVAVTNGRYTFPAATTQGASEVAARMTPQVVDTSHVPIAAHDSLAVSGRYAVGADSIEIAPVDGILSLRQGGRAMRIVRRRTGEWEVPSWPALLPLPVTPIEFVRDSTASTASHVRLAWRAYPRVR